MAEDAKKAAICTLPSSEMVIGEAATGRILTSWTKRECYDETQLALSMKCRGNMSLDAEHNELTGRASLLDDGR